MAGKPNRGIDHIVHCVRNLEAARRTFTRLGFTLTPHAVHPWGTGNALIQLNGNFVELLTVDDPSKITPPSPREFGFGTYNQSFLGRREGCSMIAFESSDARRDRDEFAKAGLSGYAPFDFARQARLPTGQEVTVAFSLAFVTDERMPEAAFFVCQHRAPQFFWKPEYQRHANGATHIVEAVMLAEDPESLAEFFVGLQGADAVRRSDHRLDVAINRGAITVMCPDAAMERFPGLPLKDAPSTPHLVGYRIQVRDLDDVRVRFDASDVTYHAVSGVLQIAPDIAYGAYLEVAAA